MAHTKNTVLVYVARKGAKELLRELDSRGTPARFSELYNDSVFTTPATLVSRLKELEQIGTVQRISNPHAIAKDGVVSPGEEVKIRYQITPYGSRILRILNELEQIE